MNNPKKKYHYDVYEVHNFGKNLPPRTIVAKNAAHAEKFLKKTEVLGEFLGYVLKEGNKCGETELNLLTPLVSSLSSSTSQPGQTS
jgi:hypothetical protein